MGRVNKYEEGFSTIEGLLVLLIVVFVGIAGWMVYQSRHNSTKSVNNTQTKTSTTQTTKKSTPAVADPTVNWIAYADTKGHYSLRYPTTWVTAAHPDLCSSGILLLGPDSNSVGACGSENFGEVYITWAADDKSVSHDLDPASYSNITKESVVVSGVTGTKETGTAKPDVSGNALGGLPQGTKAVTYFFTTNGNTYVVTYNQQPSYPDVLADFNLMVTNTLKFNS